METLYQNTMVIKRLWEYFRPYLGLLTKPSGRKAFLLLLAILAMQFTTSINHIFKWFLSGIYGKRLNSFSYFLKHTHVLWDKFLKVNDRVGQVFDTGRPCRVADISCDRQYPAREVWHTI